MNIADLSEVLSICRDVRSQQGDLLKGLAELEKAIAFTNAAITAINTRLDATSNASPVASGPRRRQIKATTKTPDTVSIAEEPTPIDTVHTDTEPEPETNNTVTVVKQYPTDARTYFINEFKAGNEQMIKLVTPEIMAAADIEKTKLENAKKTLHQMYWSLLPDTVQKTLKTQLKTLKDAQK
jgi:hypothetical protein